MTNILISTFQSFFSFSNTKIYKIFEQEDYKNEKSCRSSIKRSIQKKKNCTNCNKFILSEMNKNVQKQNKGKIKEYMHILVTTIIGRARREIIKKRKSYKKVKLKFV